MPDDTRNQEDGPARPRRKASDPMLRVKADAPDALLAVVPHLLGFYPSESLVVLGLGGKRSRVQLTFRYDLPDPPDAALTADIADHAVSVCQRQRIRLAVLIGYGPAEQVVPALATVMKWLLVNGVGLREVLRAEGGRYWSLLCEDPECCPPEGRPFDPGSHPVAATMTEAGMTAMPDRAALARSLLPRVRQQGNDQEVHHQGRADAVEPGRGPVRRSGRCAAGHRHCRQGGRAGCNPALPRRREDHRRRRTGLDRTAAGRPKGPR